MAYPVTNVSMFDTVNKHTDTMCPFLQTTHQTAHGQLLDLTTAPPGTTDLSKFTVNNYMRIVTFKTAYYSFYLPVACGMLIAGINQPAAFQTAKEILLIMGQYFQACFLLLHCGIQTIHWMGRLSSCISSSMPKSPFLILEQDKQG